MTKTTADRRRFDNMHIRLGIETPGVSAARADGRPQYYDITEGDRVQCTCCLWFGIDAQYHRGEGFLADPGNSPIKDPKTGESDSGVYTICRGHLPENAVIYDPMTDECRNKAGDNTWTE